MSYFKSASCLVIGTGIGLTSAISANAAIQLTFDAADSNIGAGLYAFDLTGVPTSPTPTYDSTFEIQYFSTIGNTQNPLTDTSAPTGWSYHTSTIDVAEWYFQNTSGNVNGIFEVKGTPNLHGTLQWQYADSGNHENMTANVVIPVPEPEAYSMIGGSFALLGSVFPFCRRFVRR